MKIYNYAKANNTTDKGPRVDACFGVIVPGQCLTFSLKGEYAFKDNMYPKDTEMLNPYTMLDVVVAPSSVEQAKPQNSDKGGYGLKLVKIRVHDSSVYSYVKDFPHVFESTHFAAQSIIQTMLREPIFVPDAVPSTEENPTGSIQVIPADTIRNCLENKAVMFYIPSDQVNEHAYITRIRPDLDYFRIQVADKDIVPGIPKVDVHIETLLKLLNTTDELYARTLIDFAIAAKAVSFLAVTDDWYAKGESALSTTRVIPIIDVSKLFADVSVSEFDVSKPYVDFPVQFPPPPSIKSLAISVPMKAASFAQTGAGEQSSETERVPLLKPPTTDFILVGPGVRLEKAYEVQFVEGEDVLLTTYLNAKAGKSPGGGEAGVPTVYNRTSRKRAADEL